MKKTLRILQLYPRDMNIYGDWGNTLTLLRRAEWHGYDVELLDYNPGDVFPDDIDLLVGGGGQDSGQTTIHSDLLTIGDKLKRLADDDVPMLVICGMYQLFGHFFKTKEGAMLTGIGLLDIETYGSAKRLIGNIVTHSDALGDIVGYENHSGLTYLGKAVRPFGQILKGAGNNGEDHTEGAVYRNVIGTYLHGSLLPKNPAVADWLLEQAAKRRYGEFTPTVIEDRFAHEARAIALKRPR
ncbi:MAG TPA: glutamine amidotransferase [Patescibacteria group bacterium]|jgi:CobQ-like glutamine amidotransferase family enzyme|nr:glutamine amidotransferase [Patescibacteria group bacterium]